MKWYHERCPHFLKTRGMVRALRGQKWPEKTKVPGQVVKRFRPSDWTVGPRADAAEGASYEDYIK
jgi:hypothetical protein